MLIANQNLIDGIQDMVFVLRVNETGDQFTYHLINQAVREQLLLSDDIIGKTLYQIETLQEVSDHLFEKYQQVVLTQSTYRYEDTFINPLGSERMAETTLSPILEDGKVVYVIAVTADLTTQKKLEKQKKISNKRLEFSRQRYQSLFDENTAPIVYLNKFGKILQMNKAGQEFIKQIYHSNQEKNIFDLFKTSDEELIIEAFEETKLGIPQDVDLTVLSAGGYEVKLNINFIPMILAEEVEGVYLTFKDMTSEIFAKEALLESEERFRLIAENSSDLIQIIDAKGHFLYNSPSHERVLGIKLVDFTDKKLTDFVEKDYEEQVQGYLDLAIRKQQTERIEAKFRNHEGNYHWFELKIEPFFDKNGAYHHTNIVARDIEERKIYEKELQRLAYRDPLTGLANRRLFNDRLNKVMAKFSRDQLPFAVVMLDLDDFKRVNDQLGHDAGDQMIVQIANRLKDVVREMDTVGRLGGDEFVILLATISNKGNLTQFIKRMEKRLKTPYYINNTSLNIGISIGAVMSNHKLIRNDKSIVTKADKALYEAKRAGKNRAIIL